MKPFVTPDSGQRTADSGHVEIYQPPPTHHQIPPLQTIYTCFFCGFATKKHRWKKFLLEFMKKRFRTNLWRLEADGLEVRSAPVSGDLNYFI